MEGWQNGNAPLLKSGGRKPLEVRALHPPQNKELICKRLYFARVLSEAKG